MIRIVPYRRLYGSRILCVREVFIVCTLYYVGIVCGLVVSIMLFGLFMF